MKLGKILGYGLKACFIVDVIVWAGCALHLIYEDEKKHMSMTEISEDVFDKSVNGWKSLLKDF